MGRKSIISNHFDYEVKPSYRAQSSLYRVLEFKHPERAKVVAKRWECYTGTFLEHRNITLFNVNLFKERCYEDQSPNSVVATCSLLSSALRIELPDHGIDPRKFCEVLLCKRERSTFAWITEHEMHRFIDFYRDENNDIIDRAVAARALLEFYTAARTSDTESFSESNVQSQSFIDKNTKQIRQTDMVCYVSKKTNVKASVPVKPIVQEILINKKICNIPVSTSVFNTRVKKIGFRIGLTRKVSEHRRGQDIKDVCLYECLSTHLFRRSFATVLQRDGVSVDLIAKMMGHTNHAQTLRYIQSDTLVMEDGAMKFFQ